jgi:adenine-specific DNA-methyltransferase
MPELLFKGKEFVYNHHLTVPYRPLEMHASKSIGKPSLSGNLIIHGDNLHALKALLPLYAGKVDCVFIDPPYNTGNENWSYNDNVNSPMMKEWLSSNPVNAEDMLRHDKWCAMMYPRLKLLRELLAGAGSFWMTLDHNEVHHARALLDEIFGAQNFLAHVAWEKVYSPRMDAQGFSSDFDHLLVFARDREEVDLNGQVLHQNEKQFTYIDPETKQKARLRSLRKEGSHSLRSERPRTWYPIVAPDGTKIWPIKPDGTEGTWRWEQPNFLEEKAKKQSTILIQKNADGKWEVWVKQYFKGEAQRPISTIFRNTQFGHTHEATEEIKRVFGENAFSTPKPVALVEGIVQLALPLDGLVLDSFAGSGTTAQAVLEANKKDNGSRRFILVEGEDYADKVTAERVRRVIQGYKYQGTIREELLKESVSFTTLTNPDKLLKQIEVIENLEGHRFDDIKKELKDGALFVTGERKVAKRTEGLGGGFTYCTLGEPIDLDRLLTGKSLPDYEALGAWLFHTATGEALSSSKIRKSNWYLGEGSAYHVWLVYKPDLEFLKSSKASLTLELAEKIAQEPPAAKSGKKHLVFAPAKYVPNKALVPLGVEYAPLPFALYRVEKS